MTDSALNRVWLNTSTSGTGTITLGSVKSADYFTMAEAGAKNGGVYDYVIIDGTNVEIGEGTYTSSGTTFSRDTVSASRIGGTAGTSKISLSGTASIFITIRAEKVREALTADRTYYVRTDGNDSNPGLANTSAGAFLTIQKALDVVGGLDRSTFNVTIQVADGTYTAAMTWNGGLGSIRPVLRGNTTTPANAVISVTSNNCLTASAPIHIEGFKLSTTTSGAGIYAVPGAKVTFDKIDFGVCANQQMRAVGGYIGATSATYTISAGAAVHALADVGGTIELVTVTVTLSGTPAFSNCYYNLQTGGLISAFSVTYSGSATGKRYNITGNAVLETYGGAFSSIPGDVVGNFSELTLSDESPTIPEQGSVTLFKSALANRQMPAFVGETGLKVRIQPFQGSNKVGTWSPGGNATTVPSVDAFNAPTALGTATARNVATTRMATRARRLGYVSAATAGSLSGHYNVASGTQYLIGNGSGLGGFHYVARFVPSDAAAVSGARMFVGLRNATAAPTNVEPSTLANAIGVAQLSGSNNLQIVYGGSAAQTAIDLGSSFPANGLSADLYEVSFFAPPGSNNTVYYQVTRLNTGDVATGKLTGTAGTAVPASTTFLGHAAWRTNNATALAVGIDVVSVYIETDN